MTDIKDKIENKDIEDNSTYEQIITKEDVPIVEEVAFKKCEGDKERDKEEDKEEQPLKKNKITGEEGGTTNNEDIKTDKNILSIQINDLKNNSVNIFSTDTSKSSSLKKSSSFLDTPVCKKEDEEVENTSEINLGDKIFETKCVLYKFIKKWEKISCGTIYVYKQDKLRILFIKNAFLTVSFDFYLDRDIKPYIKNRGVGFIANGENVLLMFDVENEKKKFYALVSKQMF